MHGRAGKKGRREIMRRSWLVLLAAVALAAGGGCCCCERLFCYGFCDGGPFGPSYGHEGPYARCGYYDGPCSDCVAVGRRSYGGPGAFADEDLYEPVPAPSTSDELPPVDEQPPAEENDNSNDAQEPSAARDLHDEIF
jgi:hypothetical protein